MIGTYARSLRHLKDNVEDKTPLNIIINAYGIIMLGCVIKTKLKNGEDCIALFQNFLGDGRGYANSIFNNDEMKKISIYFEKFHSVILFDILTFNRFSSIIMLPNNFNEQYETFCKNNRKLLEPICKKYCSFNEPILNYLFCLINDKPNLFVWAVTNIYKYNINLYTIYHIIKWNDNYNKLANKLS